MTQQQPVSGRGQAHQLGDRDEQSLVAGLARPADVAPGERPLDLEPEAVVETVEQGRVLAAQLAERLQHRRVRPRSLDGRRGAATGAPVALTGQRLGQPEDGGLADPGRPGEQQRACPRPASARVIAVADLVTDAAATDQPDALARAARRGRPDACRRARSRSASGLGVVPSSRSSAWSRRSNCRSAARTSPRSAWPRIRARWAASSVGSSSRTSSQRSAWRSRSSAQHPDRVARLLGPRLVDVLGEQPSAVLGEHAVRCLGRARPRAPASRRRRNSSTSMRTSPSGSRATMSLRSGHGGAVAPERAPRVVGGLVQPRAGSLDAGSGPERLDHLLAVQPATRARARAP